MRLVRIAVLFAPLLLVGCGSTSRAGTIAFGTGYDGSSSVTHPTSVFHEHETFAWVATLRKKVSAPALTLSIKQVEPGCPAGIYIGSSTLRVNATRYDTVGKKGSVSSLAANGATLPGSYTMRVLNGREELARGSFRLAGRPGPGSVEFGRRYVALPGGTLAVRSPQTSFSRGDRMAWVANFWTVVQARQVMLTILKLGPQCRLSKVFSTSGVRTTPAATQFANSVGVGTLLKAHLRIPGVYVLRYERDGVILASGQFELRTR